MLRVGAVFLQTCFFCRAFVPFCVIMLTERTPHLPGSRKPRLSLTLSHVSGCNLMAVFILCRLALKALRKSLGFLSSALAARSEVLAAVIVRKNNICIRIHSKHVFFHISVREGRKGTEGELSLLFLSLALSLERVWGSLGFGFGGNPVSTPSTLITPPQSHNRYLTSSLCLKLMASLTVSDALPLSSLKIQVYNSQVKHAFKYGITKTVHLYCQSICRWGTYK